MKKLTSPKREYFTSDSGISFQSPTFGQEREDRPAFTFKSGAVYTGQWLVGTRDGAGVQEWPDGARYEG